MESADRPAAPSPYTRARPFWAEIISHDRLTKPGSLKDTRHFVFDLERSRLEYLPGDSLGAFGCNSPQVVAELLQHLDFEGDHPLRNSGTEFTLLREALTRDYIVNRVNRKFILALGERVPRPEQRTRLKEIAEDPELLSGYTESRDFVDVLREFPGARFEAPEEFIAQLTPVTPRLYSIASSPLFRPKQVHLCVAVVRFDTHGRLKKGLASGFLADHADMFVKSVPVYVQSTRTFRLPHDPKTDIIMVGPGTGIAPFRAFLQHRVLTGATGRNWLFFGEQHRATDFLYQEEWERSLGRGDLHRLDTAFSRDQPEKIYVQHRLLEHAAEVWRWLQSGAYFYVCGDARRMAKDVHQALIEIARRAGGYTIEAASDYVNTTLMKTEKRYLRDVY